MARGGVFGAGATPRAFAAGPPPATPDVELAVVSVRLRAKG